MKMIKLSCTLALALVFSVAVTGCHGHKPKLNPMGARVNPPPQEPGPGPTFGNQGGGDQSTPLTGQEDRQTLAAQSIYFNYDSAAVKKAERAKLDAVAQYLSNNRDAKLKIEGNCDERGTEGYNRSLGEKRALSARGALVKMGISASRIVTISNGKDQPKDPGHAESSWSQNRRDDFIIIHEGAGGNVNGS